MWPGNILSVIQFKYFSLLSNTIYSMNSVDITKNQRECIQSAKINSRKNFVPHGIYNNYSPKWRWLVLVDIYRGREAAR